MADAEKLFEISKRIVAVAERIQGNATNKLCEAIYEEILQIRFAFIRVCKLPTRPAHVLLAQMITMQLDALDGAIRDFLNATLERELAREFSRDMRRMKLLDESRRGDDENKLEGAGK